MKKNVTPNQMKIRGEYIRSTKSSKEKTDHTTGTNKRR